MTTANFMPLILSHLERDLQQQVHHSEGSMNALTAMNVAKIHELVCDIVSLAKTDYTQTNRHNISRHSKTLADKDSAIISTLCFCFRFQI